LRCNPRYAHPVKKLSLAEYEVVFGESDGECTAFGRETTPEPTAGGVEHQECL
jgi:hypothetical protein